MISASRTAPTIILYLSLSLIGIVLISCAQYLQGQTTVNGFLLIVGMATLVARFFWLPYAYLIAVCIFQMRLDPHRGALFLRPTDVLLCAGGLLYLIGTLRVHAFTRHLGPYDARLHKTLARPEALPGNPRSGRGLNSLEAAWLIAMIPVTVLFAQILAQYLRGFGDNQLLILVWGLTAGILGARTFFDFWRRTQMEPETARVFLQENLWQETRSDQDRLAERLTERGLSWRRVLRLSWTAIKIVATLIILSRLMELL